MNPILWGILAYVLVQLTIGLWVSRRIASEDDYLLAGRSLGLGLASISLFATWFGAETCIGAAGAIYEHGLAGGSADPFGYGLCIIFMGVAFAVPLWRRRLTTLADLFRERYSVAVERGAVLLMVPTSLFWAAAQIRAFGQVLDASAGVGVTTGISLAAAVVIVYTVTGGLRADVITDLIQGVVIILGLFVLLAIVGTSEGLLAPSRNIAPERLQLFGGSEVSFWDNLEAWAIPICGSVVAQELAMRVLASKSAIVARRAALLGGSLYLVIGLIPVWIGLVGAQWMPNLEEPEQILPTVAQQNLPVFLYILFAGALVSAILSTVDSTLLAAASLVSHNLLARLAGAGTERSRIRLARLAVVCFGILAYVLALQAGTIYDLVESASAFGSAGIFVILVFGLYSKLGGPTSALAALGTGVVAWIGGTWVVPLEHPYLCSLGAAATAYCLVAVLTRKEAPPATN